jgi:hypothetical protein
MYLQVKLLLEQNDEDLAFLMGHDTDRSSDPQRSA